MARSIRWRFVALCLCGALFYAGLAVAGPVDDLVAQVSQAQYTDYLNNYLYAGTGYTRQRGATGWQGAQANIVSFFTAFGLSTSLDAGVYSGKSYTNVVGIKLGATTPDVVYFVGAHYDSVNCPGADDNASGVAGVLEAARVLSNYTFEATLIFAAFDQEELGLIGSKGYVANHPDVVADIAGMISMDMIAYNDPNPARYNTALIYGRTASADVKNALAGAITLYSGGIQPIIKGDLPLSDHAPFEAAGVHAALLIEGAMVAGSYSNPYYHKPADSINTPNYIDYAYATRMTRAVVGYLATQAVLHYEEHLIPEPASGFAFWAVAMVLWRRRARRA